jgi:thiamine transporter
MNQSKSQHKTITVREIAEMGIAVALGTALSYASKLLPHMPMGGTLALGIIPVFYIALKWGLGDGLIAGLALGIITMATDWYFVHPAQILLDYPLPGLALGLAGLPVFRKGQNWWMGVVTGGLVRYAFHVTSGLVFFAAYAKDWKMSPLPYSLAYNAIYIVPSIAVALIVIAPLRRVKALWQRGNDL